MFMFAVIICLVCSVSLSLVSEGLRDRKELNVALDMKKNILKAVGLKTPIEPKATSDEINKIYNEKITEFVVDPDGKVVEGKIISDVGEGDELYPVYEYVEDGKILAYAYQIIGKGLWSTLYGYLAVEPDAKTIRGITYYKHGETPGLGAEIEKDWFQNNFKGKKFWNDQTNELKPTALVKGAVKDQISPDKQQFYVDGISGATMTSKGVTEMINREVRKYEPYFQKIRN